MSDGSGGAGDIKRFEWPIVSVMKINEWAAVSPCAATLQAGQLAQKCIRPPGKCPVCKITSPALGLGKIITVPTTNITSVSNCYSKCVNGSKRGFWFCY